MLRNPDGNTFCTGSDDRAVTDIFMLCANSYISITSIIIGLLCVWLSGIDSISVVSKSIHISCYGARLFLNLITGNVILLLVMYCNFIVKVTIQ